MILVIRSAGAQIVKHVMRRTRPKSHWNEVLTGHFVFISKGNRVIIRVQFTLKGNHVIIPFQDGELTWRPSWWHQSHRSPSDSGSACQHSSPGCFLQWKRWVASVYSCVRWEIGVVMHMACTRGKRSPSPTDPQLWMRVWTSNDECSQHAHWAR